MEAVQGLAERAGDAALVLPDFDMEDAGNESKVDEGNFDE